MSTDTIIRPKRITSDTIWNLYLLLKNLEKPYIFYEYEGKYGREEELFYIADVEIGYSEDYYYELSLNLEEPPIFKPEWVRIIAFNYVNGKASNQSVKVSVNALSEHDIELTKLLARNDLRIPEKEDLLCLESDDSYVEERGIKLPAYNYSVNVNTHLPFDKTITNSFIEKFERSLKFERFSYKKTEDDYKTSISFLSINHRFQTGFAESVVTFYGNAAETSVGMTIPEFAQQESINNKYELLELINYMNMEGVKYLKVDIRNLCINPTLYSPRIYVDNEGIRIATIIDGLSWHKSYCDTEDYILKYIPELLIKFMPYAMSVIRGEKKASEVIAEMKAS